MQHKYLLMLSLIVFACSEVENQTTTSMDLPENTDTNEQTSERINDLWQSASINQVADGSLIGGFASGNNKRDLYVCRASADGKLYYGKFRYGFKGCNIPVADKELPIAEFETLVVPGQYANWQIPLEGETIASLHEQKKVTLFSYNHYICRADYENGRHIGTWQSASASCAIGYGGKARLLDNYELLNIDVEQLEAN